VAIPGLAHRSVGRASWPRILAVSATTVLLGLGVLMTEAVYRGALMRGEIGYDATFYAMLGRHFLETGQAYFPSQSSPYEAVGMVNVYPPTALYLFVPASFTPLPLWWIIPLAVIGWSLYRLRPAWWAWPLMALACVVPLNAPAVAIRPWTRTIGWSSRGIFMGIPLGRLRQYTAPLAARP
jgi:hypothetical protein